MNKIFLLLLTFACILKPSSAGQVPEGLKEIIKNYTSDSTGAVSFNKVRGPLLLDSSIKFRDIKVGTPIEVFLIEVNKLKNQPDSIPVKELLSPANRWEIPIYANGRCIYSVSAYLKGSVWFLGASECCGLSNEWQNISAAWPKIKGVDPILIECGNFKLLHFPHKGNRNLTFVNGYGTDSTPLINDYNNLTESRKTLLSLKNHQKKIEQWLLDHPEPVDSEGGK